MAFAIKDLNGSLAERHSPQRRTFQGYIFRTRNVFLPGSWERQEAL
jgi:hypothetical protein